MNTSAQETQPAQPEVLAITDTAGRNVNAHGGCIIHRGSTWYWYGEARPERGFTSQGVRLYTSVDPEPSTLKKVARNMLKPFMPRVLDGPGMRRTMSFIHEKRWTSNGLVLKVVDSIGSPIERGCIIERPKVIYNHRTERYVMLFHLELKGRGYEAAQVGFAVSDTPEGPFIFHHAQRPNAGRWPADWTEADIARAKALSPADYKEWTPEWQQAVRDGLFVARDFEQGQMSRDMTVWQDGHRRWWHIYSSEENMTLQAAELTDDCLGYTGRYYRIAAGGQNEAPVLFQMKNRLWMVCSGCTGWAPNEARMFSADSIDGQWTQHPSPMRGDGAEKTFGGQGAFAFDDGKNTWFVGDVWNPRSLANSRYICSEIEEWAEDLPVIYRWW